MKRYASGQSASYGIYIAPRAVDIRFVGADGEKLMGREGASYFRLPTWMVVALGPALGGAFVMAFPLLVIVAIVATTTSLIAQKVTGKHAYVARGAWQPAASYFKGDQGERPEGAADPALAELEAEVSERAANEKQDNA